MKQFFQELLYANKNMNRYLKIFLGIVAIYMCYRAIETSYNSPDTLIKIMLFIVSVMVHEVAHGVAAYYSGDDTAKRMGRLTLNPLKHIDAAGIILPAVLILTGSRFVIGWAKPVPVNYYNLKNGRLGEFLVSIAGILTNIVMAITGALLIKFFYPFLVSSGILKFVIYFISVNVILAVFNIIPIPPLDGSKIVASIGGKELRTAIFSIEKWGFFIIILLAWAGVLSYFIYPMYNFIIMLLDKLISL